MSRSMRNLGDMGKRILPVVSCLVFAMLMIVQWPWPIAKIILSTFPLIALCFWIVNQPEQFSMAWSFIIGFILDVVLGQPLGVTALVYLGADVFLRGQRSFFLQQAFRNFWMVFAVVTLAVNVVQWLIASMLIWSWIDFMPVLLRILLGLLFFPLVTTLLYHAQRFVASRA